MNVLKGLEPKKVFEYFEEIANIPHGSYNEKEISDFVAKTAQKAGLKCKRDELCNCIVTKPATAGYENEPPVILQGHMDMVCEKRPGYVHDFKKDPLKLRKNDKYIWADGTTLGGDDGIAVAYMLSLMTDKKISHPKLYFVFTVSEEVGMDGAKRIDLSKVKAKRLLNIDSDEEEKIIVGCAGGVTSRVTLPVERTKEKGHLCEIKVTGLLGGHSGTDIHLGRANANKLMGRILIYLRSEGVVFYIVDIAGGTRHNVIPSEGSLKLLIKKKSFDIFEEAIGGILSRLRAEFAVTDPSVNIDYKLDRKNKISDAVLDETSAKGAMTLLNMVKDGVLSYSAEIEGLVEPSSNMAVVNMKKKELEIDFSIRSLEFHARQSALYSIRNICEVLNAEITTLDEYPEWKIVHDSPFCEKAVRAYREVFEREPEVTAVHAGLECAVLGEKIKGLDAISIGPKMRDIHTPSERLSIESAGKVYKYIKKILEAKEE
mgnify:CR=1 FL=1